MSKCCEICGHDPKKPDRSVPQLRRYFEMINSAWHHWPESHRFQPRSKEELRKWLQAQAGWRQSIEIEVHPNNINVVRTAIQQLLTMMSDYAWPVATDTKLAVYASKSIAFNRMPHSEFCKLSDAVEHIIVEAIGAPIDQIMAEAA